jgi:hypothetical protein
MVVLDYLAELIKAFFDGSQANLLHLPHRNMAQAVLSVARDHCSAEAILGLSSDVLIPKAATQHIVDKYKNNGRKSTALFVKLPTAGHKKWNFDISSGYLRDIRVEDCNTQFERVLLLLNRESLLHSFEMLSDDFDETTLPPELRGYQTGWNLIMKAMIRNSSPIAAELVDIPVCNVNVSSDFSHAEQFVKLHGPWE